MRIAGVRWLGLTSFQNRWISPILGVVERSAHRIWVDPRNGNARRDSAIKEVLQIARTSNVKQRQAIPSRIEHEILFRNQSVCCVCQKSGVQIHHIDGNPRNNSLTNLCVLCIEHHAQASSKSNMVRGLSQKLLKKYKAEWEGHLARKRQLGAHRRFRQSSKIETDLIRFEIKKTAYGLHDSKSQKEINAAIDYLYNWSLVEGRQKEIIDSISEIHWLLDMKVLKILAHRLYEFFWQFVDPQRVPMSKRDERIMIAAIELLGHMGIQAAIIDHDLKAIQEIVKSLDWFHKTATVYRRPTLKSKVLKSLRDISSECKSWIEYAPDAMKAAIKHIDLKTKTLTRVED
jgi:hypothetical protein